MDNGGEWCTYVQAAKRLHKSHGAIRQMALRGQLQRVRGNDGKALVLVLPDMEHAALVQAEHAMDEHPERTAHVQRTDSALVHALESHIKTLQGDNGALKERLAEAEARFAAAETRIEGLLADLVDRGAQHADERAVLVAQIAAERTNAERAIAAFASLADRLDALAAERARPWWRGLKQRLVG
jgi:septal ring factor EnvC (AmiA/AmiB activator)